MNLNEQALTYPWAEAVPPAGQVITLAPGLHWLRMALPFALDHINLWLLDDALDGASGFTAVDCGITSDQTRACWEKIFDTVFDRKPLLRVIATHFHPDHLGLAHWLTRGGDHARWQVPLWMTASEYTYGRLMSAGSDEINGAAAAAHFRRHGLQDEQALAKVRARGGGYYPSWVPAVPSSYRRMQDGDVVTIGTGAAQRNFKVIVGFGHSPEHACLFYAGDERADNNQQQPILIAGDMVLPRISTNISVFDLEPEANPLPRYLASLKRLQNLPANTLVLPSHGKPFIGLHQRITQQLDHHQARLDEVEQACRQRACSAAEVVPVLFKRELDLHQLTFALGEALAHLHALWFDGRLVRRLDDDGVYRFTCH